MQGQEQGLHYRYVERIGESELKRLMEDYGEDVWQYAYFLTKKRDMADDVSQEVFIKAFKSIGDFRGEATIRTWLLKITRNTAFSYRRKAYFRRHLLTDFTADQGKSPSAEETALALEFSHALWSKVMRLSRKYREAIILSAHYQQTMEEMADTLQISVNTAKSRLRRARRELLKLAREELQDE